MGCVASVERLTITLDAGTNSASANISASSFANCIPFITKRCTTAPSTASDWSYTCTEVYFQSSPNRVTVETTNSATRAMVIEVTVVEFATAAVTVYQGQYSMNDTEGSDTVTIADQGSNPPTTSFLYHTWRCNPVTTSVDSHSHIRGRFDSDTQLGFTRTGTDGAVNGRYYVAQALSGAFTVQQRDISIPNGTSVADDTITSVTTAKTFLIGSIQTDTATGDNNRDIATYIQLLDEDTVRCTRNTGNNANTATVFVVSLAGSTDNVQRGTVVFDGTATTDTSTVTLTTGVAGTRAMAWSPLGGSVRAGQSGGTGASDVMDAQIALDFSDEGEGELNTLQLIHISPGNEANLNLSWEVIEWELSAAAPSRRIFIIT